MDGAVPGRDAAGRREGGGRDLRRPGLCLYAAEHRLLLRRGSETLLLAFVDPHREGVDLWRTDAFRSCVPPLRADRARALGGDPRRWAHRFAQDLLDSPDSPLHEGRWLLSAEHRLRLGQAPDHGHFAASSASSTVRPCWEAMIVEGHPDGYLDWFLHNGSWEVLPLRPLPGPDDGRVKAYRKQARDGSLPPVLLWWVSGLDCHLVLDGHARLAAAAAESVAPPLLTLHRTLPGDDLAARVDDAARSYTAELDRFAALRARHGPTVPDGAAVAGPRLARVLDDLDRREQFTWAWPLPGGAAEWDRIAACVSAEDWPAGRRG
ncbi:hypothetical protein [Streptomyces sp. SID5785]|uniref:hypothetical protein n=1 Tax=Streptomyces sp. SID5785 TaxID=2690309 RepID=UPI001F1AC3EF|nr:hypothetical protein [Streptomyces sp. SID5785]